MGNIIRYIRNFIKRKNCKKNRAMHLANLDWKSFKKHFSLLLEKGLVESQDEFSGTVEMESLEDLIDLAVNQNKRVIHDKEESIYFTIDGEILYTYSEPE